VRLAFSVILPAGLSLLNAHQPDGRCYNEHSENCRYAVVMSPASSQTLVCSTLPHGFLITLTRSWPVGVPSQRLARSIRRTSLQSVSGSRVAIPLR
jgi:hypothetical protein